MLIAANTDIHWPAGFIDGEGSFCRSGSNRNGGASKANGQSICLSASQNDAWHLEKVVSIVGEKVRRYAYKNNANGRSHFHQWALNGSKAAAVMKTLYPLLSPRRQEKIDELFLGWRRGPQRGCFNRSKTHCRHGHEYTPENTYFKKRGGRDCRTCQRVANLKYLNKKSKITINNK